MSTAAATAQRSCERCDTCKHFRNIEVVSGYDGACTANAPRPVKKRWPPVNRNEGCGDWVSKYEGASND